MKKFLTIMLMFLMLVPAYSADMTTQEEQYAQKLMARAQETKSVDDFNTAVDYYIKLASKYKEPLNTDALDIAVSLNMDRYNTVQQVKYKNNAKRYANYAIQNGTQNLNTIVTAISIYGEDLDTQGMIRFYDYMCKINPQAGNAIKNVFAEQLTQIRQYKTYKSAQKWNTFGTLLNTYLQNRPSYRPTYSTTTGTIDANGYVNINTMSY